MRGQFARIAAGPKAHDEGSEPEKKRNDLRPRIAGAQCPRKKAEVHTGDHYQGQFEGVERRAGAHLAAEGFDDLGVLRR